MHAGGGLSDDDVAVEGWEEITDVEDSEEDEEETRTDNENAEAKEEDCGEEEEPGAACGQGGGGGREGRGKGGGREGVGPLLVEMALSLSQKPILSEQMRADARNKASAAVDKEDAEASVHRAAERIGIPLATAGSQLDLRSRPSAHTHTHTQAVAKPLDGPRGDRQTEIPPPSRGTKRGWINDVSRVLW